MSVEKSGRAPDLRRPTMLVPVALVAGSLAIPILCMGIPLVLGAKLRERFFVSKSVMEKRIRGEAAVLQAKHNTEIKELISCLEKEIQVGNRTQERILNVEIENMSLKTIEIILTRKTEVFKDVILHEKLLRDQVQNDLLSKLQLLQSENQEIKAAERRLLEEVVELKQSIFNEKLIKGVVRQNNFVSNKFVRGTLVNILFGMELYENVFTMAEQKEIVSCVYQLQDMGKKGQLQGRAYSEPRYGGKGRVTLQFGCNYNYTKDKLDGTPLGVFRNIAAEPLPPLFETMIKRLVRWNILPSSCTPDSCIVNIYEQGDCFPPHKDSTDFERPFCTVSFVSKCDMVFGANVTVKGPGRFEGSFRLPLPLGSVLVLAGAAADVAKHCVPAVPSKRISITFRKMKKSEWSVGFSLDPSLQDLERLQP